MDPQDQDNERTDTFVPHDVDSRISHYRVISKLGGGASGNVYLAEDLQLKRPVALKLLDQKLAASRTARSRFLREARTAAGLSHANIVTIYDVAEHGQSFKYHDR